MQTLAVVVVWLTAPLAQHCAGLETNRLKLSEPARTSGLQFSLRWGVRLLTPAVHPTAGQHALSLLKDVAGIGGSWFLSCQKGSSSRVKLKGFGVAMKEDRGKELWETGWEAISIKIYVCACARPEYQILTFFNSS